MLLSKSSIFLPVLLASSVLGHGQVRSFITSTTTYPAADAYASSPDPNSPIRKLDTYGPAAPFTDSTITCGSGGNNPAAVVAPVTAGSTVTFDWGAWTSVPVMTYLASCPNGCANFKGDTGNVWVKIQQDGYVPTRTPGWAEELIEAGGATGHGTWSVQIPSTLPNGEYIIRHEILGLHLSFELNGAQFYPNCVQISVTGGGSVPLPSGIALPGAYQPTDPGIYLWLYTITPSNSTYIIPGGPILYGPGASGSSSSSALSSSTSKVSSSSTSKVSSTSSTSKALSTVSLSTRASSTSTKASSAVTSSTKASSSSVVSSTTSSSSASTSAIAKYGQCGGQGWTGGTTCVAGSTCTVQSVWYSQCL